MAMALSPLERAYRARLDAIRQRIVADVAAEYDLDPDDILASFDRFVERVAPRIEAGQAAAQLLTVTFLEQLARESGLDDWEPLPEDDAVPGSTAGGASLAAGMGAIGGMVLRSIGDGTAVADALAGGRNYAERFTDNEVRGAADREQERQSQAREIVGWEGIVQPNSCDACRANEGIHDLSEEMWRHGNCACERVPVFAGA